MARTTKETDIEIELEIDGEGRTEIGFQDHFLNHMLNSLAKYASFDLTARGTGDDDHHLIEDVAIALGMAMDQARGDTPVDRIGSATVPMDDALVTAAVDVIDRPYVEVDCPDPMYHHFFRSLAMSSRLTLHILVQRGFDAHHIVEASFKALGLALRAALTTREGTLSTKAKPKIKRG